MNRRRFLGLCGVAGVGGVTAFTLFDDGVAAGAPGFPRSETDHPRLGESKSAGWTVVSEDAQTVSGGQFGIDVTADVYTTLFSHEGARERVAEQTRGAFDRPVVLASLTRVDLHSYVNVALSVDRLDQQVLPAVESQLADQGVAQVDYEETALAEDLRGIQRTYDVTGTMPVDDLTYDEPDTPDMGPVRVPGFDLSIAGVLALWKSSVGTVYVLGSVYPDESVSKTATRTVEGPDGETREVSEEMALEFDTAAYRDAVISLVK
ncbi:twin-arginine translocation signal domain-containing protein [Halomarina salina]|uniref:Twin-arginine translocation signal domain-containing protein n=1 Tax=Halomarina salina TaxID=1872699 RepID=A0ABD5RJU4_9EURY|nr:twin-arginine translocation signal domain-containing protein [Halomarina salina]